MLKAGKRNEVAECGGSDAANGTVHDARDKGSRPASVFVPASQRCGSDAALWALNCSWDKKRPAIGDSKSEVLVGTCSARISNGLGNP